MKKLGIFAMAILLVSTFAPLAFAAGGPIQPPVDTTTLYSTTIAWGPANADPGRAYDTGSGELIFNVYDTLISMGEPSSGFDTYESYWMFTPSLATAVPTRQEVIMIFPVVSLFGELNLTDPPCYWFEPVPPDGKFYHIEQWVDNNYTESLTSCDVLYIGEYLAPMLEPIDAITIRTWHVVSVEGGFVTVHHFYYDFPIRTDPVINFWLSNGTAWPTPFSITDVEYTFEKVCARARPPSWMFNIPCFDQWYPTATFGMGSAWASVFWAKMIQDAFEIVSVVPPVFRINVGIAFADNAFKQIMTQTWAAIMSKSWCLSMGDFDPATMFYIDSDLDLIMDWYDTGFTTWPRVRGINAPYNVVTPTNYCGTGPYRVTTADSTIEQGLVIMARNPGYWQGWPSDDQKAYLEYIQIDYVPDWAIRKQLFLDGKSDVCAVPRSNMFELLDAYGDPTDVSIKTIPKIVPVLSMDAMFYTWDVDTTVYNSLYTGVFPDGAPTDFMNNIHVRNAFTYSFNRTKYITEAWYGEGICRETPGILGLIPDYYTKGDGSIAKPWKYNYNIDAMYNELSQAYFVQGDPAVNQSVTQWGGFHIDIFYNSGNDPRRIACEIIQAGFAAMDAKYGTSCQITIQSPDWATYLGYMEASTMPVWGIGWLADYADSGNWYGPYMHSYGDFSIYQHYYPSTVGNRTGMTKDMLIDFAFKTPDVSPYDQTTPRGAMYADLDDIYLADNPGFPDIQPQGRRWAKYWVKGWYYNALYPSTYYYHLYKEDTCWANVNGPTAGVPDAKTDMRDVSWEAGHFGAKAPNPAATVKYDPKWAPGTYGNGGSDTYGDRKVDMKDIAFTCQHFLHQAQP